MSFDPAQALCAPLLPRSFSKTNAVLKVQPTVDRSRQMFSGDKPPRQEPVRNVIYLN
jgi:hypothetical protein